MDKKRNAVMREIIKKVSKNKISTTEVADCLGKTGAIPDIAPINKGHFRVGRVFLAYGYDASNWAIHEQIEGVKEGDIVVVESYNCGKRAAFGELVTKYLILYKDVSAVVVNGYMRDAHRLIKENFPVWCKGVSPIGYFNEQHEKPLATKIVSEWKKKYENAIAICDDGGVVIISSENINREFLRKLDFIELQEDIWHHCVDTKKWSTYDTVCLKKYFDTELLPVELRDKFRAFLKEIERGGRKV
ncbi:MAG: RraA family protein [Euryarchaeota archaeon]|nr:RraA family protein [Euryarchaeota archaeon]